MISAHHVVKTIEKKGKVILLSLYHAIDFLWKDNKCVYFITVGLNLNHETPFFTSKLCVTKKFFIATSSIIQMQLKGK